MQDEVQSLHDNHTFKLERLPKGKRALKNKWMYKMKQDEIILQSKYRARLVAKGFSQRKGIDFDDIFSSIMKLSSIHMVKGLAVRLNLEIEQIDVKTAFMVT